MPGTPFTLEYYLDDNGEAPFIRWLEGLRDRAARARIAVRLDRIRLGNFGQVKALGDGVCELKIDYGPGYRVYYAMRGQAVVLLLIGGDKATQARDIRMAKTYWQQDKEG